MSNELRTMSYDVVGEGRHKIEGQVASFLFGDVMGTGVKKE